MLDRLDKLKGRTVVVDYKVSSSQKAFAKGVLDIDDVNKKIIVIGLEGKVWFIDPSVVIILRVDEEDANG